MNYETRIGPTLEELITPLRRLVEEGGPGSFLILTSDPRRNYYLQTAGALGDTELRLEAVSNDYLDSADALRADQVERMVSLGWSRPDGKCSNFYRELQLATDDVVAVIARFAVRTLVEVYGMGREDPIHIELELE